MRLSYMIDMDKESVWMLVTANADTKENLPYVQELGDFIAHEKYFTIREGLPSYLIKYTLSGEGELHYDDRDYIIPAGHFYWIDCQKQQHYHTSKRTDEWRVIWVHFWGPNCSFYYKQFLAANNGRPDAEMFADNNMASNIYALMDLYNNDSGSINTDLQASALLTAIMAECVHAVSGKRENMSVRYVRQVQDYITAHYRENITLDVLAKQLSLNKFYIQKLFKQQTGQTPTAYLIHTRLNHAKGLLRTTELPIVAVAIESGIENTSHFIKLFKTFEGVTPAVYRNHWRVLE